MASAEPPEIVVSEIHYNPAETDRGASRGDPSIEHLGWHREFIELHNPRPEELDLSGYTFADGIQYTFPSGTVLAGHDYVVIAREPEHTFWSERQLDPFGPYEGKLSNGGETIVLQRPDRTTVVSLRYDDESPWPRGPDGYGSSLERIAPELPPNDFHSWRGSLAVDGTPGESNSVRNVPSHPILHKVDIAPDNPTSVDDVNVRLTFDAPSSIDSVSLLYETIEVPRTLVSVGDEWKYWIGTASPSEGDEWTHTDFDDSPWSTGRGAFGYAKRGSQFIHTYIPEREEAYSTMFFRHKFIVDDVEDLGFLRLRVRIHVGYVCTINGVEAARHNAPDAVDYTSRALERVRDWYLLYPWHESTVIDLGAADNWLVQGENVISIVSLGRNSYTRPGYTACSLEAGVAFEPSPVSIPMTRESATETEVTYVASIPPFSSQTLVRFRAEALLSTSPEPVRLPHDAEPRPFESYFVYDGELESKLPVS